MATAGKVKDTKVKGIKYTIEYIVRLADLTCGYDLTDGLEALRGGGEAEVVDIEVVMIDR